MEPVPIVTEKTYKILSRSRNYNPSDYLILPLVSIHCWEKSQSNLPLSSVGWWINVKIPFTIFYSLRKTAQEIFFYNSLTIGKMVGASRFFLMDAEILETFLI